VTTAAYVEQLRREQPGRTGLPSEARAYLLCIVALAMAATLVASTTRVAHPRWPDFAILLVGGALAQLLSVHQPGNQVFHTGLVFTVAAALVLPAPLVVAVCVAQHLPEWLRRRYRWYIQTFNIANFTLSGLAAWAVRQAIAGFGFDLTGSGGRGLVVLVAVGSALVLVNHLLLARMLKLARGRDLKSTHLVALDGLTTDLALAAVGAASAYALLHQPALLPIVLAPLVLAHPALIVPTLREQATRDHKTGLLNSRAVMQAGTEELERAIRFDRPLAVLMCDVDGLREINNRYGHLAGDSALVALADALRAELRGYDICGRFGGDEFLVVLPETAVDEAQTIAGRIGFELARARLPVGHDTIAIGVSAGVATRTADDATLCDLIARADAAMYSAKNADDDHVELSVA
jgi:diguanylate cyclase (GGDEF)-like protein